MNTIRCLALAGLGFALSGCATVINGTSQDFAISTDPDGARAVLSNGAECTTPCELSLKRRHDLRIDLTKEGYEPAYVLVQSRLGGAMAGNLLLGGIIGGAIDAGNGSTNHLVPQPLAVRLARLDSGQEAMLLAENGEPAKTVAAHNDDVREDVAETIGAEAAGLPVAAGGGE